MPEITIMDTYEKILQEEFEKTKTENPILNGTIDFHISSF